MLIRRKTACLYGRVPIVSSRSLPKIKGADRDSVILQISIYLWTVLQALHYTYKNQKDCLPLDWWNTHFYFSATTQSSKPITARVSPRGVWLCSLSRQLWLSSVNVSRWNRQKVYVDTNFVDLNSTTTNSENTKQQKLNSARTLSIRSNGCLHCTQLGFKIHFYHCMSRLGRGGGLMFWCWIWICFCH